MLGSTLEIVTKNSLKIQEEKSLEEFKTSFLKVWPEIECKIIKRAEEGKYTFDFCNIYSQIYEPVQYSKKVDSYLKKFFREKGLVFHKGYITWRPEKCIIL